MATDSRFAAEIRRDPGALRMRSFRAGDTHVVKLAGELDLATADDVERELRLVELSDARVVAIDLRELTFIESTGIRLILHAQRRSSNGRLVLVKGDGAIQRLFEICDVANSLTFVDQLPSHHTAAGSIGAGSPHARSATSRRVSQAALAAAVRDLSTRRRHGMLR